MNKHGLRKQIFKQLNELEPNLRVEWQHSIENQFFDLIKDVKVEMVAIYHSFFPEVETHSIIDLLNKKNISTCLPCLLPKKQMAFARYYPGDPLETIGYKFKQPLIKNWVKASQMSLVVVPGLVFSSEGNRLGYGGGYYDRYFASHPELTTLSIAFPIQIHQAVEDLVEAHDHQIKRLIVA